MPAARLYVYGKALDAVAASEPVAKAVERRRPDLADQLRRSTTSSVLNTAEGANEFSLKEKLRFYRMARRSAAEAEAVLAVIAAVAPEVSVEEARARVSRVIALLTRTMSSLSSRDR